MTDRQMHLFETGTGPKYWRELKARYPDTILLLRFDDHCQTFGADRDAVIATLGTDRVDYETADKPISQLLQAGHKVAIGEQIRKGGAVS